MRLDVLKDQFEEGWLEKLGPFLISPEFDEIFKFLKSEARAKKVICPNYKDTFKAFRETKYKETKVVFILQDPYHQLKGDKMVADGIPMSCSNTGILQPSLELFYEGMEENLNKKVGRCADLSYLCHQGILILNTSLTVELHKPGSHKGVWKKFMDYLFNEVLNYYSRGLCVVAFGKHGQDTAKSLLPFLHWTFDVEHPAAAAHRNRKWDHQRIFTSINEVLKGHNEEKIIWDCNEYAKYITEHPPETPVVNEFIKNS
jgi:uracil-DNA glycosylase